MSQKNASGYRIAQYVIWTILLVSVTTYSVLILTVEPPESSDPPFVLRTVMPIIFGIMSAVLIATMFGIRKKMFWQKFEKGQFTPETIWKPFLHVSIVSWLFSLSISIYGIIIYMTTFQTYVAMIFSGVSVLMMFIYLPTDPPKVE